LKKPPLPDPLKTPPFFSQWETLDVLFHTPLHVNGGKNRGESDISEMKLSDFPSNASPRIFFVKKTVTSERKRANGKGILAKTFENSLTFEFEALRN
jgi:hypothetical protein